MHKAKKIERHIPVLTEEGLIQHVKVLITKRVPGVPEIEVDLGDAIFTKWEVYYILNQIARDSIAGEAIKSPLTIPSLYLS